MTASKDLINSLNDKSNYENFSEEVTILSSTDTGNMSLYTVINKNGVTFHTVPGMVGLSTRGYMGFVNGDRARPIMISGLSKSDTTTSSVVVTGIPVVNLTASGCATSFSTGIVGLVVTFTITNPGACAEDGFFWDFGDGQYYLDTAGSPPNAVVHTYQRTGTYNVTVSAFERDSANDASGGLLTEVLNANNVKTVPFSFISHADAYTQFILNTWSSGSGVDPTYNARYQNMFGGIWSIWQVRKAFRVPLSAIAANTAVVEQRSIIYISGGNSFSYIAYDDDGGSKPAFKNVGGSDMGMTLYEHLTTPATNVIGSTVDSSITMVDSDVEILASDLAEPPYNLPDPQTMTPWGDGFSRSGWFGRRTDIPDALGYLYSAAYVAGTKRDISDTVTV